MKKESHKIRILFLLGILLLSSVSMVSAARSITNKKCNAYCQATYSVAGKCSFFHPAGGWSHPDVTKKCPFGSCYCKITKTRLLMSDVARRAVIEGLEESVQERTQRDNSFVVGTIPQGFGSMASFITRKPLQTPSFRLFKEEIMPLQTDSDSQTGSFRKRIVLVEKIIKPELQLKRKKKMPLSFSFMSINPPLRYVKKEVKPLSFSFMSINPPLRYVKKEVKPLIIIKE